MYGQWLKVYASNRALNGEIHVLRDFNEKPKIYQSTEDDRLVNYNSKALYAIFNRCNADHIKLISSCEIAKDLWDILQTIFEASGDVKRNKLLSFITHFESLRMHNEE